MKENAYRYVRLQTLRQEAGMLQRDVAKILDVPTKQYGKWERGEQKIPVEHLTTLANRYETTVDYITEWTKQCQWIWEK